MHFLWPDNLWGMWLLALLPLGYWALLRRRAQASRRLRGLMVSDGDAGPAWHRHASPVLLLAALVLLLLALARPVAPVTLPWAKSTIMLALDISLSMRVQDVKPTRMVAAQEAVKAFLAELPAHIDVGLVTFAGSTQLAQQPTLDREALSSAIDSIQMQRGTAIGNAIVLSLAELFPEHGIDLEALNLGPRRADDRSAKKPPVAIKPVPPGSDTTVAIILLSDGRRTTGIDTLRAAQMAADRGVRVHVVGLGTADGHLAMGDEMAMFLQLDEPTLRQVAQVTGGEYHQAASAEALRSVYENLGSRLQMQKRETEITALLAVGAALLLLLGAGLSVWWFGRVV